MQPTDSGLHLPAHIAAKQRNQKKNAPPAQEEITSDRESDIAEEGFPMAARVVVLQNAYTRSAVRNDGQRGFVVMTLTGPDITTLEGDPEDVVNLAFTGVLGFTESLQLADALKKKALEIPIDQRI